MDKLSETGAETAAGHLPAAFDITFCYRLRPGAGTAG